MANISKTPDVYYQLRNGYVESTYGSPASLSLFKGTSRSSEAGYRLDFPFASAVTACSIDVSLDIPTVQTPFTLRCSLYADALPDNSQTPVAVTTAQISQMEQVVAKKFSFSGLNINASYLTFRIEYTANDWGLLIQAAATAAATYSLPSLTVSPSPATVYDIPAALPGYPNAVTLSFGNRNGQTLNVKFRYNSTVVWNFYNIDTDSWSETLNGFFTAAGATGSSIRVNVDVSDELGRTATANFTVIKPQGSTATPVAPRSTTADGTLPIAFAWSVSSDWGAQTAAELQWSTNNATWQRLALIENNTQTWTAPALKFPGGTIYWRVAVRNAFGTWGAFSNSVSFTVRYEAVSQVVPVNSQTSGTFVRGAAKTFQAALETTGQVYAPFTIASADFRWRAGTSGDWTSAAMTVGDDGLTASVTVPANTFPAGDMQWQVSATDNTGRTTETGVYTLTALVSVVDVRPIRPIDTVESNSGDILFQFGFVSLDGRQPPYGSIAFSTDNAEWDEYDWWLFDETDENWIDLNVPGNFFEAGTVYWKVKARNAAGVWGEWSKTVSFKVLGAPKVDGVTGDGKPFLTISWQTPTQSEYGQQAYKIRVDGRLYGPYFGADARSYTLKEPLEDGAHRIEVAAQNRFGLWSEWAEGNVVVQNVPGVSFNVYAQQTPPSPAAQIIMFTPAMAPVITRQPQDYRTTTSPARFAVSYKTSGPIPGAYGCTVTWQYRTGPGAVWQAYTGQTLADTAMVQVTQAMDGYQYRARLSNRAGEIYSDPATFYYGEPAGYASELREGEWKAATGYFLIYRDGKLIAKTYNNYFTDWAAIGTVSYEVLQVIPGGYYTRGTIVQGTVEVSVDAPTLIPLEADGRYLALTLSEDARRAQEIQRARETVWTQYEGSVYPEAETSVHESLSASGDGAWPWEQKEEADYFDSLLGKTVIYKTPGGVRVVGVLSGYTRRDADRKFYLTARFSIQQADWRDFVDEP